MEYVRDYMLEEPETKHIDYCDRCKEGLYQGEIAYKFEGELLCEECMEEELMNIKDKSKFEIERDNYDW